MKPLYSIAQEVLEELINKRNFESSLFEHFSKETIFDNLLGKRIGAKAFKSYILSMCKAFPDYRIKIDQVDTYGNTVVVSNVNLGTHKEIFRESLEDIEQNIYPSRLYRRITNCIPNDELLNIFNDVIFIFSNKKIERITVSADTALFCEQLNLLTEKDIEQKNIRQLLVKKLRRLGNPPFTEKEVVCLALTFSGLSAKQIGAITKNSHRTIETHMKNAMYKAGCFSKLCLVEKMIANETLPLWNDLCHIVLGFLKKS